MIFMIGYRSSQWWNQPHNDKKNHLCHVFVNFVAFRSPSFNLFFFLPLLSNPQQGWL